MAHTQEQSTSFMNWWKNASIHERTEIARRVATAEAGEERNIADSHTYNRVTCHLRNNVYCPQDYGYGT